MELPSLQIGKTQDRVAAGNTIQITTSNGDVITARAITPIRTGTVAFQKIEGQGWVAFDPASSAIASKRKEIRRRKPRRKRSILITENYFFKGLVRFLDGTLYKGGDDNIVGIDENIGATGILGFANLGEDSLDFIAVYRKQDDLIIDLQGARNTIVGWFLKDYSMDNQWLGADFYGVNQLVIERMREVERYEVPNGYPFPFDGANAWGYDYTVEPFTGNVEPLPIPEFAATQDGTVTQTNSGETVYPLQGVSTSGPQRIVGTWDYKDRQKITKRSDKNITQESLIVSTNFGQLMQGIRKYEENMSIVFNIDFLEQYTENVWVIDRNQNNNYTYIVWSLFWKPFGGSRYISGARNYQFNRNVVGTRVGNTLEENTWKVFLSSQDTITCYSSSSIKHSGSLKIKNLFTSGVLDVDSDFPIVGSKLEKDYRGRIASANIFPKGEWFAQFEQTASTSKTTELEGSVVKLILSGNDCYMFSELNYTSVVTASANHSNDTDKTIKKEYASYSSAVIGDTYQFHENTEDDYWYYDFRRFSTPILEKNKTNWFLTSLVQEVNQSHFDIDSSIDKVKVKNNRDNSIIEVDTDSLVFVIDTSESLVVGRDFTLPCSAYVGLDYMISLYEFALEYTVSYSAVGTTRNSTLLEQITVDRLSDDTLHNQIFNGILTREYDVIWKDNETYYIGQATIVSYECEDLPYLGNVDTSVSGVSLEYQLGRYKQINSITLRLDTQQEIKASLLEAYNVAMDVNMALVVSRDNYYNYIIATKIAGQITSANLFLRENPTIATASVTLNDDIGNDRVMYAEILELLPDGRWVRREEESGDVTAMNLGTPDDTTDLWSYYKK